MTKDPCGNVIYLKILFPVDQYDIETAALEEAGAIVVAVDTVVDRDTGAQKVIEDAGFKYLTAITLDDLELR